MDTIICDMRDRIAAAARAIYKGANEDAEYYAFCAWAKDYGIDYDVASGYFGENINDAMEEHEEWLEYMRDMQDV